MESYRHAGSGSGDSSRYQQLPTRSDSNQPDAAVAAASGGMMPAGTRGTPNLLSAVRVDSSSASTSSDDNDYTDSCSSSDCSSSSWRYLSSWLSCMLFLLHHSAVCLFLCCSSESIPEWESHIDNQGELFYVEFSSNLHPPNPTDSAARERQPNTEERQEVLKKKKKSKKKNRALYFR